MHINFMKFDKVIYNCSSPFSDKGDLDTSSEFFQMCGKPSKTWRCPWSYAMVDDIAPAFKAILEDNFLSFSSNFEDTEHNRMLCWKQRLNIDCRLEKFLRCTTV